ncbi:MAG: hypothetical protein J6O03_06525, partial [Butyrivibrio sp.]|nr:hypothetical protein [Butyrivibrio sp.]
MTQIEEAANNVNKPTFVTPTAVTPDTPAAPASDGEAAAPGEATRTVAVATATPVAATTPAAAQVQDNAPAQAAVAQEAQAQAQVNTPAAEAPVVDIADEIAPTADAPAGINEGTVQNQEYTGAVVDITDEEVALADKAPEGELKADAKYDTLGNVDDMAKKPNLWWLLIILLLGEAGREMYKKHQEKMKEKEDNIQ